MKNCKNSNGQSIFDHGLSVRDHLTDLISYLKGEGTLQGWKIPEWLNQYRDQILSRLLPEDILEEYTLLHDCGKSFVKTIDENGKIHFSNHAQKSHDIYLQVCDNEHVAKLIKMDMDIHNLKAIDLPEFCQRKECISLLLSGLAEIHSNSELFGGTQSVSFKIKYKQIDNRGKAICKILFN
jgi:hypothetical protein